MKQPNQPAAQPLVFQDVTFNVIDRSGEPWLRYPQIADAFGYSSARRVNDLYNNNKEEFTSTMTAVIELKTKGGIQPVRIFSLRGAHLLGMFARTDRAKEFRRWVLNILEQYSHEPKLLALPAPPIIDKDTELAIKQRARVLADSFYPLYCLQLRHAVKNNQLAPAHIPSWIPVGMPAHYTVGLKGPPSVRCVITFDHQGTVSHHRELNADDIVWSKRDLLALTAEMDLYVKATNKMHKAFDTFATSSEAKYRMRFF